MTTLPAVDPFQFDYQRHLAAEDLLPEHQDDFQRLIKLLRYAPRFQLLFARIADESYRRLLIGKLQDLLGAAGRPVQTADLSDEQQFPDFAALETWLETAGQGRAVIHLTNTSHWLQGPRVETLNLRRNALAEKLDATLLWWLPADTLARLARDAPDAWSWRGGVFDFIAERPDQAEPVPIRRETPGNINPLTLAQRSRRLAVLHQQLDGERSTTIPDDFRLNLLLEQADLYKSLGQWDLANQKLRQEALPLAERLGDARGEALALGRIADILADRGELDEALRIRTQEELPVYERLGDAREKAMTQSKIADILRHHGELDEALHVFQREVLPAFERVGDVYSKAAIQGKIARILEARGELDTAMALHEQRLPIALQTNDLGGIAHCRFSMARIRLKRGDHQRGGLSAMNKELAELFANELKRDHPDAIGAIGELLAQVLALDGRQEEALAVLDQAESSYGRATNNAGVLQVRALRSAIAGQSVPEQEATAAPLAEHQDKR